MNNKTFSVALSDTMKLLIFTLLTLVTTVSAGTVNGTFVCVDPLRDCNGHGQCYLDGDGCYCDNGYVTHDSDGDSECNYKQKDRWTVFALSFFLGPTGASWFYTGFYIVGGVKLLVLLFFCCGMCCMNGLECLASMHRPAGGTEFREIWTDWTVIVYVAVVVLWWIVDDIIFAAGVIDEANGVALY